MNYRYLMIVLITVLCGPGAAQAEDALSWSDCVKTAIKNHPDLVSAAERVKQSKAVKEITRSAYVPQVTGNAGAITNKNASLNSSGSSSNSSGRKTTTYSYDMSAQQLLFDGFKTSFDLSTDQKNIEAARYFYDVTSSNVRLRLRSAFAGLLSAQEALKVNEEIAIRRKQNVELVKLRYEGGSEHKGSLMRAEADQAQALYSVDQAKRDIYLAQRQLSKELGLSRFIPAEAEGDFRVKEEDRERPDFDSIADGNPLLRQLIAEKEAARYGLRSAKAAFFPQIFMNYDLGNTNTKWPPDKNEWSFGSTMTIPIFDGGSRIATVDKSKALLAQTLADERSGRDGVILTLADTWTKLQDAIENVGVQKKFLDAGKERSKIAEAEYSIGLLSFDNWTIIEDDYVRAKTDYLNAETNALLAEANWIQAKGGTLDYDQE